MGLRNRHLYHHEHVFFITTTCNQWMPLLAVGKGFDIVSDSLNFCLKKYDSSMLGYVIMPNHIHTIIYFSEGKIRADLMRDFKKFTSVQIRQEVERINPKLLARMRIEKKGRAFQTWQDRFDEVYLVNKRLLEVKLDYIHNNPLQERWNLVARPEDYKYSSAGFYYRQEQGPVDVVHYMEYF